MRTREAGGDVATPGEAGERVAGEVCGTGEVGERGADGVCGTGELNKENRRSSPSGLVRGAGVARGIGEAGARVTCEASGAGEVLEATGAFDGPDGVCARPAPGVSPVLVSYSGTCARPGSHASSAPALRQDTCTAPPTQSKRPGRRHAPGRLAIAATLCAAALVGTVAYAAIETDFLATVFGDRGHEDVGAHEVTTYSKDGIDSVTEVSPARTWYEADLASMGSSVAGCVQEVGASAELGGYTMTLEGLVMDENDIGVASFVVASQKGFEYAVGEDGWPSFADTCDFRGIGLAWDEGGWANCRPEVNEALSTPTELHLIVHFDASPDGKTPTQLTWRMHVREGEETKAATISVELPEKRVASVRCASPQGDLVVCVSPFGYVVDYSAVPGDIQELMEEKLVFSMRDGSELLGYEEGEVEGYGSRLTAYNLFFSSVSQDRSQLRGVPAFYVNTNELESVTMSFRMDEDGQGHVTSTGDIVFRPEADGLEVAG